MALAYTQLFFNNPINVSVQIGDIAYYVAVVQSFTTGTGTQFDLNNGAIREVGKIVEIYETSIVCEFDCQVSIPGDCGIHIPGDSAFIMFSKDNKANMSSILGYHMEVEMVNNSNEKAKLFAVSTNVSESSK